MAAATRDYISDLSTEEIASPQLTWLRRYLQSSPGFASSNLHPVQPGSIQNGNAYYFTADFIDGTHNIFNTQDAADAVANTFGNNNVPVLTWPRTAGVPGTHPIKDHTTALLEPAALKSIAMKMQLNPDILLRHLNQNAHLSYRTHTREHLGFTRNRWDRSDRRVLRLCLDQANHMTVVMDQEPPDGPWTVLILADVDNCLGIDFNPNASHLQQPLRESTAAPHTAFDNAVTTLSPFDRKRVMDNPLSLVSLYTASVISSFSAHIELYQRNWSISYEPYANTSVVYGYAYHRDAVRQLAKRYTSHLRYLHRTLDNLDRFIASTRASDKASLTLLNAMVADFSHFAKEIGALKSQCDQFLEQQVSKLALQDARASMREAKDLKRLSYMAFIFVPLSLTSSFFGMNVRELGQGTTPVWVFVVTAVAILGASLLVMQASVAKWIEAPWKALCNFFGGIKDELFPTKLGEKLDMDNLHTVVFKPQAPRRNWRFWKRKAGKKDYGPLIVPPPAGMVSMGMPAETSQQQYSLMPAGALPQLSEAYYQSPAWPMPVVQPTYADPLQGRTVYTEMGPERPETIFTDDFPRPAARVTELG
ncbi:hypothetical protein BS50DRAFT_341128 [Corynespora cassiicola Philippines]|uniref:Uncharacterized protein n=1 Tax=Corynespora cassiicola Philippines TaxID=1448308 RepID=A0A2T2NVF7_CORCC|nr:hypothetical protein BS50DRAFT_341128 [Corynespora cassiicola Philippines]